MERDENPFAGPSDTPPNSPCPVQFYTAQEYPSSPIEPPRGEFETMDPDSLLEAGSAANDNPFRNPEPAGFQEPRTPPDQIIDEDGLAESDKSYSETSSPAAIPHNPIRYRRDAGQSNDHARVWLRTTEDYQRYAARKRIAFDDAENPPSPTLAPVSKGKRRGEQLVVRLEARAGCRCNWG